MTFPVSSTTIEEAHHRIQPFIHRTPIFTNQTLNKQSGASLFFKCENLQKVGAFKARGAMNAVLSLSEKDRKRGVAIHSSGNHGQALAWAAQQQEIPAHIVMPSNSPQVKMDAVRDYGANVVLCEPTLKDREETLEAVIKKTGAHFIHPYNDYRVIAGQATCAKELLEEIPELDFILAPVGGGGLLSGTALSAHYFSRKAKVFGCEPEMADDAKRSYLAGHIVPAIDPETIADGLKTSLGDKTFPIIHELVQGIITVTEKEIVAAIRLIWERMKLVVEPSAAVTLAALFNRKEEFLGKKVGIIFTGGNLDLSKMGELLSDH